MNARGLEASSPTGCSPAAGQRGLAELCAFVQRHRRLFVLTGAGVSTGSGIPGYRDHEGRWQRRPPVLLQDFLRSESVRRRYWARSLAGWPIVARARSNGAHAALARLETAGIVWQLVTQNVDGLHQQAGSAKIIELHGNIGRVICLDCGADHSRHAIQATLAAQNPALLNVAATAGADGDADLEEVDLERFRVPACAQCAGLLKPDVVFFGEGVPRDRVDGALKALGEADAMLVIGSSLMVYSGYRFCARAAELGTPIAALNLGRTRADPLLALKVERPCAEMLAGLVEGLDLASPRRQTLNRTFHVLPRPDIPHVTNTRPAEA